MPVQFRREDIGGVTTEDRDSGSDMAGLREALAPAAITALVWTVPAAALGVLALRALKRATIAADKLLHGDGSHWTDMWMPAVLLSFFGAIVGGIIVWRVSSRASAGAGGTCLVAAGAAVAISLVLIVSATAIYAGAIPTMGWVSIGAMAGAFMCAAVAYVRVTH